MKHTAVTLCYACLTHQYHYRCLCCCCCYCHCCRQIESMPFADAVISESMRLHSPTPFLGFTARKDVVVGGVTVLKGTNVFVSQSKTAVSDNHFTNAKQFWPEVSSCLTAHCVAYSLRNTNTVMWYCCCCLLVPPCAVWTCINALTAVAGSSRQTASTSTHSQ
jgi:Cytochrome P450